MTDDNLAKQILAKHRKVQADSDAAPKSNRFKDLVTRIRGSNGYRRAKWGLGITAVAGAALYGFLLKDFVVKRQDYPARNVLFKVEETTYMQGSHEGRGMEFLDRESDLTISAGGNEYMPVGTQIASVHFQYRDEGQNFEGRDANNMRYVQTKTRKERIQGGVNISGANHLIEEGSVLGKAKLAELEGASQNPDLITYHVNPERGIQHLEIIVERHEDGSRTLRSLLSEYRNLWGWPVGDLRFREGTELWQYHVESSEDEAKTLQLFHLIEKYNSAGESRKELQRMQEQIIDLANSISHTKVYRTHEDGIVDWLPQESTIILPTVKDGTKGTKKLRVENQWDLWPGRYPGLKNWEIGSGNDSTRPFSRLNNGGYTLEDGVGVIAQVKIIDWPIKYGEDSMYQYFLDKNGDGRIDEATELIEQVLQHPVRDEDLGQMEVEVGPDRQKVDVTYKWSQTFMAGADNSPTGRIEDLHHSAAIDTFMPDQVNRDTHSDMVWINRARGAYMLTKDQSLMNLTRTLNQEGTIEAPHDIIRILRAAKRDYANSVEAAYTNITPGITVNKDLTKVLK